MSTAAVVSFRLGGRDGVSVEAAKWTWALGHLGFEVRTVAGSGPVDVTVAGLERGAGTPSPAAVEAALEGCDLVVVENLCSLPLNPEAASVVAGVLRGRPAVLRHHDLAWQRPGLGPPGWLPPSDPRWVHVTINHASQAELRERGIAALCRHNRFPVGAAWVGRREETRRAAGLRGRVLLHPVRAIPRKDVPAGVALAAALGATYWLTGPAEDGYGPRLERALAAAAGPVHHGGVDRAADAYAASDAVVLSSLIEGFGNPLVESALARRPLAVRRRAVVPELRAVGFRWFDVDRPGPLRDFLARPDRGLLDHNHGLAAENFGLDRLPAELATVVERVVPVPATASRGPA